MKNLKTKDLFQDFTDELISDETSAEIEINLKNYFTTLIEWSQEEREEDSEQK